MALRAEAVTPLIMTTDRVSDLADQLVPTPSDGYTTERPSAAASSSDKSRNLTVSYAHLGERERHARVVLHPMGEHGSFEQLARVVHGVAAFGGTVEDVLRMSGHSRDVLVTALTFIDPNDPDTDETAWHHALAVLSEALQRLR